MGQGYFQVGEDSPLFRRNLLTILSFPKGTGQLKKVLQTLCATYFAGFTKKARPQWGTANPSTTQKQYIIFSYSYTSI